MRSQAIGRSGFSHKCTACRRHFANKLQFENHITGTDHGVVPNYEESSEEESYRAVAYGMLDLLSMHSVEQQKENSAMLRRDEPSEIQGECPLLGSKFCNSPSSDVDNYKFGSDCSQIMSPEEKQFPPFQPRKLPVDHGDAAVQAWVFSKSQGDTSIPIFSDINRPCPDFGELSDAVRATLEYCSENTVTLAQSKKLYDLLSVFERSLPVRFRYLKNQFKSRGAFASYLLRERKHRIRSELKRTAIIKTDNGTNCSGVFRNVSKLVIQVLHDNAGVESIIPYGERQKEGQRVYSAPRNSNAMGEYQEIINEEHDLIVLIDLYCDSTILSSSGSQSANIVRVRFGNISGASRTCNEVDIVPVMLEEANCLFSSRYHQEKHELWHRFMFLVIEDITKVSRNGVSIEGRTIYRRLGIQVADQVQERPSCGRKGHDSFFDCSHCMMLSRLRESRNPDTQRDRKGGRNEAYDSGAASSSSLGTVHSLQSHVTNENCEDPKESLLEIQTGSRSFSARDVYQTVTAQIRVARSRITKPDNNTQQPVSRKPLLQADIGYLDSDRSLTDYMLRMDSISLMFSSTA
ncbi:Zinc finger C2H2 domain containing protein [Gracilaria domingensis]|nr:Zinc finger C2H2 domain containing protein [Gracilaria domingensis]